MFVKMLELEGVFIKKEALISPPDGHINETDPKNGIGDLTNDEKENQNQSQIIEKNDKNSNSITFQKKLSPNAGFDIFKFKILTLLICRGEPKVKAGLLFDLVYRGKEIPEKVIIWSNSKLKEAFEQLFFFSEIMPKMFYLQCQTQNDIKQKLDLEIMTKAKESTSMNAKDGYRSPGKMPVK